MNKLIDYKRKYIASDGEEYVNMGSRVLDVNKLKANNINRLTKDYNGRIDSYTFANLSNRNDIDLVMYINHIFNPFAIKEGDVIYAPNSADFYYKDEEPTLIDGKKHSDSNIATKKRTYAENIEYLAKMGLGVK